MTDQLYYTVEEIAQMLKVSKETIRRLVADKEIDVVRVRSQVRISKEALDKYLNRKW